MFFHSANVSHGSVNRNYFKASDACIYSPQFHLPAVTQDTCPSNILACSLTYTPTYVCKRSVCMYVCMYVCNCVRLCAFCCSTVQVLADTAIWQVFGEEKASTSRCLLPLHDAAQSFFPLHFTDGALRAFPNCALAVY